MFVIVVIVVGVFVYFRSDVSPAPAVSIRVGWPISWVPAGPLASTLGHTDIAEHNGLKPEFQKFTYGAPLAEAALAGSVDAIFVGQVPALSLLNKTDKWVIVARLSDGRAGVIVPKDSTVSSIGDLRGKNFDVPFGTLNYMQAVETLKAQGLESGKDVSLQNIDAVEGANAVKAGTPQSWGSIDAFSLWDPTIAQLEESGTAKVIDEFRLDGVVVMSKDFIAAHPEAAKNFLKSMIQSYDYYVHNANQSNAWYLADTGLSYSSAVLAKSASIERNMTAKGLGDINMTLEPTDIDAIQEEADKGLALDIFKKRLDVRQIIDQSLVQSAEKEIRSGGDLAPVKVIR